MNFLPDAEEPRDPFQLMADGGHEQILYSRDSGAGYRGIIAIHDTTLGPALGGTRLWTYSSGREALIDALRLSKGMTYKAAVAGLASGGGKSVIWPSDSTADRSEMLRAHGRAIESLGGRYITAEDIGTSPEDMEFVASETAWVTGRTGRSGDPSPLTAYGVWRGIKACAAVKYGDESLDGRRITVQGLGSVGYQLCRLLAEEGVRLTVTDVSSDRLNMVVDEFGARPVGVDRVYEVDTDVFSPCALGAIINERTIPMLRTDIVAGAANNQLAGPGLGQALRRAGILYAPDYVINAGGLVSVYGELHGWSADRSREKAGEIYESLLHVLAYANAEGLPTDVAADRLAELRLSEARQRGSEGA